MARKREASPKISGGSQLILLMLEQFGSVEAMRKAIPEITDAQMADFDREARAILATGMITGVPQIKRKKKAAPSGDAYQLKITLNGSKPPIWRRVVVPSEITLAGLHHVIQLVMGWGDEHLHAFNIDGQEYSQPSPDDEMEYEDEAEYRLGDVMNRPKGKFRYVYDFGDSWEHDIVLEKIIPAKDAPAMMVCTAGKMRCPMEDCGGIWGYYDLLKVLADPKNPEHENMKEWAGGVINPEDFDINAVNKNLKSLA